MFFVCLVLASSKETNGKQSAYDQLLLPLGGILGGFEWEKNTPGSLQQEPPPPAQPEQVMAPTL